MKPIRHVLCATDLLTTSPHTLETAMALAKYANATLTILHVLASPVVVPEQYLDAVTMDQLQKRARTWALKELQKRREERFSSVAELARELSSFAPDAARSLASRAERILATTVGSRLMTSSLVKRSMRRPLASMNSCRFWSSSTCRA